jgi:hypothetical protein
MKRIGILLLFVLANSALADAQEKYRFTVKAKQDTIVVYDTQDKNVLMYGKDVFVYRQTPIKVTGGKKGIVFSSQDKEWGRISSKKCKKIYLADGSLYVLSSGKRKLSYKKDGQVCASSTYSYTTASPYYTDDVVNVEMSVDRDLNFVPFLFFSVLAHIQGTKEAELLVWLSLLNALN